MKMAADRRKDSEGGTTNDTAAEGGGTGGPSDGTVADGQTAALRESEERYRTLVELSPDTISVADMEGRITIINGPGVRMLGYDAVDEVLGKGWLDFVAPEQRPVAEARLKRALASGGSGFQEYDIVRKDGTRFPAEVRAIVLHDAEGRPVGGMGVLRDLTDRKQAEAEAHRSRDLAKTVLNAIDDAICVIDVRDFRVLDANRAFIESAGKTRDEIIGGTCHELTHGLSEPCDNGHGCCPVPEMLRTGRYARCEHVHVGAGGEKRIVSISVSPLRDSDGTITCAVHVARDLTVHRRSDAALVESETRQNALLRAIPDIMFRIGRDGTYLDYHAPDEGSLLAPPESFLGRRVSDIMPPDMATPHMDNIALVLAWGETRQYEYPLNVKGEERTYEARMVKSGPDEVLSIIRDVTDKKRSAEDRAKLELQFQQAQKMEAVGQLAGGVAHDFNNLLSVIISYCGFALDALPDNSPIRADILEVRKAGERAAGLTRQLLAFSRKQVIEPRDINANEAVSNLAKMLRRLIGENIVLEIKATAAPGLTTVDPTQFDQAMTNLAVNARDAMPKGGRLLIETANVTLDAEYTRTHPDATPGEYVVVMMSDTGTGIPAEILPKIFEPFFTTKEKGKGTGLGLSMVYGAMKQNGGHVSVYSEVGVGTTFKLYFKRADARPPSAETAGSAPETQGRGESILVVEDEDAVRAMFARTLSSAGYNVVQAANGAAALDLFWTHKGEFALVISDVVMPGLSGPALGEELARLKPGVKVLYCSGYTDDMLNVQGVLKPGMHLLTKPIEREVLLAKVEALIAG